LANMIRVISENALGADKGSGTFVFHADTFAGEFLVAFFLALLDFKFLPRCFVVLVHENVT